jgi:hypothetical protein
MIIAEALLAATARRSDWGWAIGGFALAAGALA